MTILVDTRRVAIGKLQVVPLLEPLRAAVLRVAAVLERAPLLLQPHDLVAGAAVQALVQLAHRQRHQQVVVDQVLRRQPVARAGPAHSVVAAAAAAAAGAIPRRDGRAGRADRVRPVRMQRVMVVVVMVMVVRVLMLMRPAVHVERAELELGRRDMVMVMLEPTASSSSSSTSSSHATASYHANTSAVADAANCSTATPIDSTAQHASLPVGASTGHGQHAGVLLPVDPLTFRADRAWPQIERLLAAHRLRQEHHLLHQARLRPGGVERARIVATRARSPRSGTDAGRVWRTDDWRRFRWSRRNATDRRVEQHRLAVRGTTDVCEEIARSGRAGVQLARVLQVPATDDASTNANAGTTAAEDSTRHDTIADRLQPDRHEDAILVHRGAVPDVLRAQHRGARVLAFHIRARVVIQVLQDELLLTNATDATG
uniref:Uncharacterized protein n=1 Tax=Anopheles atroparvus TaxID=41427 RepID=A0A182J7L2_ANOAO